MKIEQSLLTGVIVLVGAVAAISAPTGSAGNEGQVVITVLPAQSGSPAPELQLHELSAVQGKSSVPVVGLQRLSGDLAGMQLFVLLDDSTRSSSLGTHIGELKTFLECLPATTQVAVGYMQNGTFPMTQSFTTDHAKAADSLRPPLAAPGRNGSPYFALSELVKHWPSKEVTARRAVVMLTDGVDPYFGAAFTDDPYVDTAIQDAQKEGVTVYPIYLRGAGLYGRSDWVTNMAQSRLDQLAENTGGHAYFQGFSDPVTISPFLKDVEDRLDNQYRVTIAGLSRKGLQPVKLRSELPGLKIYAPTQIFVR